MCLPVICTLTDGISPDIDKQVSKRIVNHSQLRQWSKNADSDYAIHKSLIFERPFPNTSLSNKNSRS